MINQADSRLGGYQENGRGPAEVADVVVRAFADPAVHAWEGGAIAIKGKLQQSL